MLPRLAFTRGLACIVFACAAVLAGGCGGAGTPPALTPPPQGGVVAPTKGATAPPATAPAQAATAPPATADTTAAEQTVLDYYDAIRQQDYARAYRLWDQEGAASGQTFEQFTQGFADTAGLSVQLDHGSADAGAVVVPITITAVLNIPNHDQQVQHFRGTYTVRPGRGGERLAGAQIAEIRAGAQPSADVGDPLVVLQSFYAAINNRDFARAYTYWENNGAASGQTFTQFRQGYAATARVAIAVGTPQIGAAAGSAYADTPIVISATRRDGSRQTFCGAYTLRRVNVPPFDQFGWRIYKAAIATSADVQAGSDPAKRLLEHRCQT